VHLKVPNVIDNTLQVALGSTAFNLLLENVYIQAKFYPGLGYFLTQIDHQPLNSNEYWEFFVNETATDIGSSSYVLKPADQILFKKSLQTEEIFNLLKNKKEINCFTNHRWLATLIMLIGHNKDKFPELKIKDNVDLVGLSPLQDQWNLHS